MVARAGLFWQAGAGNYTVQARVNWPEHTRNVGCTHLRGQKRVPSLVKCGGLPLVLAKRSQGGGWRQRGADGRKRDRNDDRTMVLKRQHARKSWWKRMPEVEEVQKKQMRGDLQYGQKLGGSRLHTVHSGPGSCEAEGLRAEGRGR